MFIFRCCWTIGKVQFCEMIAIIGQSNYRRSVSDPVQPGNFSGRIKLNFQFEKLRFVTS